MSGNANTADRINVSILEQNTNPDLRSLTDTRAEFQVNKINEVLKKPDDYEVQVKSFNINTNNITQFTIDGTEKYRVGIAITGGTDDTIKWTNLTTSDIQDPIDFIFRFNNAILSSWATAKTASGYTGTVVPILNWNYEEEKFYFYYSRNLVKDATFNGIYYVSPAISKMLNISTEFDAFSGSYSFNIGNNSTLNEQTVNSVPYYYKQSIGFPLCFSNIDEVIIQTSQIPVYDTFTQEQKDSRNSILKVYKYDYQEALKGCIIVNYDNPDYYSIDSHYPLKQLDIQIFLKYIDGSTKPLYIQQYDHFSLNLEFKKKQIF